MWNPAEGITVNGTTATIAAAPGNREGTDAFLNNAPGWFFTYTEQVTIEKDKDYPLTAAMKQQVRELTLIIKPTGDAAGRITEIVAHLTGAARTLDFATDTYGAASNVVLPFTKITEGDDAGKWKAHRHQHVKVKCAGVFYIICIYHSLMRCLPVQQTVQKV